MSALPQLSPRDTVVTHFLRKPRFRLPPRARRRTVREAMEDQRLLTITEAAEKLSVSPKTVRKLCSQRELEHVRIGRAIRITPSALDAYIEAQTVQTLWLDEEVA